MTTATAAKTEDAPTAPTAGAEEMLAPTHWENTTADPADNSDTDSSLGDDNASSTASINSSILEYRTINGRTYHAERGDAQYWASNDNQASEALDIIHHTSCLIMDGKLNFAPVKAPRKVLDVGTGTGIWAMDFGDEFPEAEVIGTDISPIQPR
jgi:tRNA G46 methylase TrmB